MKKVFFGVAVVAIALSASAFTNAKVAAGDVYGNTSTGSPQYSKLTQTFNPDLCQNSEETRCAYTVTQAGAPFVIAASYTEAQLEAFANQTPNPYVTRSSSNGLYTGN